MAIVNPVSEKVSHQVGQLGNSDYKSRKAAESVLRSMGFAAIPTLEREVRVNPSPEIRQRAASILRDFYQQPSYPCVTDIAPKHFLERAKAESDNEWHPDNWRLATRMYSESLLRWGFSHSFVKGVLGKMTEEERKNGIPTFSP